MYVYNATNKGGWWEGKIQFTFVNNKYSLVMNPKKIKKNKLNNKIIIALL